MRAFEPSITGALGRPALVLILGIVATGCTTQLKMSELRDPKQPTATIRYSAVRHETRRFPDYSAIDASILASERGSAKQRTDSSTKK